MYQLFSFGPCHLRRYQCHSDWSSFVWTLGVGAGITCWLGTKGLVSWVITPCPSVTIGSYHRGNWLVFFPGCPSWRSRAYCQKHARPWSTLLQIVREFPLLFWSRPSIYKALVVPSGRFWAAFITAHYWCYRLVFIAELQCLAVWVCWGCWGLRYTRTLHTQLSKWQLRCVPVSGRIQTSIYGSLNGACRAAGPCRWLCSDW